MARIFECADCDTTFAHGSDFYIHVVNYHPERIGADRARNRRTCSQCGRRYRYLSDLHYHLEQEHVDFLETAED